MLANDDLGNLGRLGNQMFQYTSLRGLAAKHGYEYCLPPREVVATRDPNCVNSDITMFECFTIPDAPKHVTNFPKVMESGFGLDKNLWEKCPDNISLYGYFQTEKYFKHIESEIREDFTFKSEILEPCKEMMEDVGEAISLHVRRTDYLKNPNHTTLGLDYYKKALKKFNKTLPVIIFSDDPEWCQEQELFSGDRFMVSESGDQYIDMCLMTLCEHHIIANSSFSWWGAWLSNSNDVVAPSRWFGEDNSNKDIKDLYVEGWRVI